jgi:hypothetical protein
MDIQYLHLAGFKRHPDGTDINLLQADSNILECKGEELHYYFNVILGIIFGLGELEKQEYRDTSGSNIFTGLIRLQLDDRLLIIERDFETDILACMLDFQGSSKVVFHDRDFVDNGPDRSYLRFLRDYLAFTDKTLLSQLTFLLIDISEPTLDEVLNTFYDISSPKIQLGLLKAAAREYSELLESRDNNIKSQIRNDLFRFEKRKQLIKSSLKLEKQIKQLERVAGLWKMLYQRVLDKQNESLQLKEILNQRFPLLKDFDGDKLRKDVIVWKELISQKTEYDKKHSAVLSDIDRIEKMLNGELILYRSIPGTFESDIEHFREHSEKLKKNNATLKEIRERTMELERKFARRRSQMIYLGTILPLVTGLVSYLVLHLSLWLSAGGVLIAGLIILVIFASLSTRFRSDLWIQNFEESKLKNENAEIEQWLQHLRSKSILVEDFENKDIHKERHRRARELNRRLENLRAERASFAETWSNNDGFKKIQEFNGVYGKIIDLNRPDLEEYLENFAELKQLLHTYDRYDSRLLRKIRRYGRAFQLLNQNMNKIQ